MELEAEVAKLKEENEELRKKQVLIEWGLCICLFPNVFIFPFPVIYMGFNCCRQKY